MTTAHLTTTSDASCSYDRRRDFIIDDQPEVGLAAFVDTKNVKLIDRHAGSRGANKVDVTAVAVRDQRTTDFSKIIRFGYSLPPAIEAKLNSWIAVPLRRSRCPDSLFLRFNSDGSIIPPAIAAVGPRSRIESWVLTKCQVLTLAQRCADWFYLRMFRLTGTIAASILLESSDIRPLLGIYTRPTDASSGDDRGRPTALLAKLMSSWLSSARSSEAMMRGTANEDAMLSALRNKPFIVGLFECGMLAMKSVRWITCSPDGIALIRVDGELAIACVECKSAIGLAARDRILGHATVELLRCTV
jgi:hypothetical protein